MNVTRRDFLARATAAALAGAGCLRRTDASAPRRPNVLFIFDDQHRADALGYRGCRNVATPNLDRLASEGMTFANAVSTCPICTPYRGMLLTGRYPTHTGIVLNWMEVNPAEESIARRFADAGYATGYVGKWHLAAGALKLAGKHAVTDADRARIQAGRREHFARSPHTEYVPPGPARMGYDYWAAFNFHASFRRAFYYRDEPIRRLYHGYETDGETDLAIQRMRNCQNRSEPFFLAVAPHPPWNANSGPEGFRRRVAPRLEFSENVAPDRWKDDAAPRCYYSQIANVDDNVGRLLAFLDDSGLAEDTIVVFTSDHGEMMGSHGRMNKMVPYTEASRVPLIVRWPGRVPAGVTSDHLFTPMDHLPTLCALAGLPAPNGVDGTDMSPACRGESVRREAVLMANYVSNWDYFDTNTHWPEWRGVKTETHTYVRWLADGREELYHDLDDPCQMRNLAYGGKAPSVLRACREWTRGLMAEAHDAFLRGCDYADWYDEERNLVRTALGPVQRA